LLTPASYIDAVMSAQPRTSTKPTANQAEVTTR
jgi:hypothetical protein